MRIVRVLVCIFLFGLLCGCYDYNELNMQELVNGVTIDYGGEKMSVCVSCAKTDEEEGSGGTVYQGEGKSFFDAVRSISTGANKKLYWGHARTLIIGEQQAKRGIGEIIDTILRVQDVYPDIAPIVVRGESAKALLDASEKEDVSEYIFDIFSNERNSRRFKALRVWQLLGKKESTGVYILPVAEIKDEKPELSGGAVMKEDKLCGYLSGEQMLLLSLLTRRDAGGYLPTLFSGEDKFASFEILGNDIRKTADGKTVRIIQKCVLSPGDVSGDITNDEMKRMAERYLSNGYSELIEYAKENKFGDVFEVSTLLDKNVFVDDIRFETEVDVRISNVFGGN